MPAATTTDQQLQQIAHQHLGIDTLDQRDADSLDWYDVAVWEVRAALTAAYELGRSSNV